MNQFENLGKNRAIGQGVRMLTTDTRAFPREHHSVHAVQKLLNLGVGVADFPLNTLLGDIGSNITAVTWRSPCPCFGLKQSGISVQEIAGKNADTHDSEHGNGKNDQNIHTLSPKLPVRAKCLYSPAF